jgi:hypothetical protein
MSIIPHRGTESLDAGGRVRAAGGTLPARQNPVINK